MRTFLVFLFFTVHCFSFPEAVRYTAENVQQEIQNQSETAPAPVEFDREKISSYKEQPEFDYTEEVAQENWWTKFKRYVRLQWQKFLNWLSRDHMLNGITLFLLEMIPYLILVGILFFAIWLFIKLNPASSYLSDQTTGSVLLNDEEEIIQSKDIRKLIEEAVATENYRLAVRYYYLLVLQQLSETGYIDYQFPKTDQEYLAEIKQESLKKQFEQITRIYDFIWYGSFDVTAANYPRAKKEFEEMQELIKIGDGQNL